MAKLSDDGLKLVCERAQRSWTFGNAEQAAKHMRGGLLADAERDDVAAPVVAEPVPEVPPITSQAEAKTAMQRLLDWIA